MRLAVVTPFADKQHGTERVLAELLERLAGNHGVEIHLYAQRVSDLLFSSSAESSPETSQAWKIIWHRVSSIPGPHLFQFVWWYFANRFARRRDAKLRELVPDLIYSPGINASDVEAITVHIVFHAFYERVSQKLRLRGNSPVHWPRIIHRILYYRLIMSLERRIYSNPKIALSAVSQMVARQLEQLFGRKDVLVIRNAVDARQFNAAARLARRDAVRTQFGIAAGEFVFLLIGNDWKKKGLDALLEAFALCRELPVRLLVVGKDSPADYQKRCEELQLRPRVNFLAPSPDVMQFYAACDAYAGPSLEDAYGLPILESMACGLPVIASAAAGVSEIISDGENGLVLSNPRDVKELARLMRKICSSRELGRALGAAAEKTAAQESWETHAARSYEYFSQIIARREK